MPKHELQNDSLEQIIKDLQILDKRLMTRKTAEKRYNAILWRINQLYGDTTPMEHIRISQLHLAVIMKVHNTGIKVDPQRKMPGLAFSSNSNPFDYSTKEPNYSNIDDDEEDEEEEDIDRMDDEALKRYLDEIIEDVYSRSKPK